MRRVAFRFVTAIPVAALVALLTSGGCVSQTEALTEAGTDGDAAPDLCDPGFRGPVGRACSQTNPCPASLDCYYEPGCASPHGTCQVWAHCMDVEIEVSLCGCDGGFASPFGPYAYPGFCRDADAADEAD